LAADLNKKSSFLARSGPECQCILDRQSICFKQVRSDEDFPKRQKSPWANGYNPWSDRWSFDLCSERSQDVRYQIMGERPLVEDAELRTALLLPLRSFDLENWIPKPDPHLDIIPAL